MYIYPSFFQTESIGPDRTKHGRKIVLHPAIGDDRNHGADGVLRAGCHG